LPVTPETEQAILNACAQVNAMSAELVKALGLPDENQKGLPPEDRNTPPEGGVS